MTKASLTLTQGLLRTSLWIRDFHWLLVYNSMDLSDRLITYDRKCMRPLNFWLRTVTTGLLCSFEFYKVLWRRIYVGTSHLTGESVLICMMVCVVIFCTSFSADGIFSPILTSDLYAISVDWYLLHVFGTSRWDNCAWTYVCLTLQFFQVRVQLHAFCMVISDRWLIVYDRHFDIFGTYIFKGQSKIYSLLLLLSIINLQ
jgi:hypothetical protein